MHIVVLICKLLFVYFEWKSINCVLLYFNLSGAIAAVSTYAVQTVAYLHPVRGTMSAATLRSSQRNRGYKANAILDDHENGRSRIFVIQLQGHLFFGNLSSLNESVNGLLSSKSRTNSAPLIVIVDFSLVLGIDSSAAQGIVKLKKTMQKNYGIKLCVFVPGSSDGFPCEYDLTYELDDKCKYTNIDDHSFEPLYTSTSNDETVILLKNLDETGYKYEGSQVCQTLDFALVLSENALIARQDMDLLKELLLTNDATRTNANLSEDEEKALVLHYLANICPRGDEEQSDTELLFSNFHREVYMKDEMLWKQGESSDCAKLLVSGMLIAVLENEAGTSETVQVGRMVGELGLVYGSDRMSSLYCMTDKCIVYSISRKKFDALTKSNPSVARIIDLICIEYLANRVQHVSNRVFETRCLPI